MANGLLGANSNQGLLGDIRDQYISEAKKRGGFSDMSERESSEARTRHPSTAYLESYINFSKTDDDVILPLLRLVMEQPDRDISDIFKFPQGNNVKKPTRKSPLRGTYNKDKDVVSLVRDPMPESFSGPDYRVYGSSTPFQTRIDDNFTAAHEMIHAAVERDVSPEFSEFAEHTFTDYYIPKNLLDNKNFWKETFGENEYRMELVNQVVHTSQKLKGTSRDRGKGLASTIRSTKDLDIKSLEEMLSDNLSDFSHIFNPLRVFYDIDYDKVEEIIGKPESKVLRGK
jgi:hypothetical protein